METFFANQILFGESTLNTLHLDIGRWFDTLMTAITGLGSEPAYMAILPLLYWCWNRRIMTIAGLAFLVSAIVNDSLKYVFMNPRPDPSLLDPAFRALAERLMPQSSPGFPSGHANMALTFWGSLALLTKRPILMVGAIVIALTVSYSRLFLGVHFLGDVLGGLAIALLLLVVTIPALTCWDRTVPARHRALPVFAAIAIPTALAPCIPGDHGATTMGFIAGFVAADMLCRNRFQYRQPAGLAATAARAVIGLAVLMALRAGLKIILPPGPAYGFLRFLLMGIWVAGGAPYAYYRISWLRAMDTIPSSRTEE